MQHTNTAQFMNRVYMWMCSGLIATAITAYLVSMTPGLFNAIFSGNSWIFYGLILLELGMVVYLSAMISKMRASTAGTVFFLYSVLNGITMASIFAIFSATSIGLTFAITAGMFGLMSLYGYTTKTDITTVGNIAFMALIGIILASIVNLFLNNAALDWVISYIGVIVFVALTAYDTQKIKAFSVGVGENEEAGQKASIIGALNLYLDFVNLFLFLLRIFGKRD